MVWLFLFAGAASLASPAFSLGSVKAGDAFEILKSYETQTIENGSDSGFSRGRNVIVERVLRVDERGVELQYEELIEKGDKSEARIWQMPARIFRPYEGKPTLINSEDLEARVDPWLKKAKMSRAACDQSIFTWIASKIECDPKSALEIVAAFDLWVFGLSEGLLYNDANALQPMPLKLKSKDTDRVVYEAELIINPDKVRQAGAEAAVAVGKITAKPISLEDATRDQQGKKISGTIVVEIEADLSGFIWKKTTIKKIQIQTADGDEETRFSSVIDERKIISETSVSNVQ
jgi:hypothetical protein